MVSVPACRARAVGGAEDGALTGLNDGSSAPAEDGSGADASSGPDATTPAGDDSSPPPDGDLAGDATWPDDGADAGESGVAIGEDEDGGDSAISTGGDDESGDSATPTGDDAGDAAAPLDAGFADGANPPDAGIGLQGKSAGQPCAVSSECASAICAAGACIDATSCLALLNAEPGLPDREYEIDPDGAGMGAAPFVVYCDMTTDGGGWTTLPLRFADPSFWSITQAGEACVAIDAEDDQGRFHQYQSARLDSFAYTYMAFVPPIAVTSVRFVDFEHDNGGSDNTMDFFIGGLPPATDTSFEGWYFADPSAPGVAVGYAFPTAASCTAPYAVAYTVTCSRDALTVDGGAPTAPFPLSETVPLASTIARFEMGLVQGCPSYPLLPNMTCEQFLIDVPPAPDGVWTTGIAVR